MRHIVRIDGDVADPFDPFLAERAADDPEPFTEELLLLVCFGTLPAVVDIETLAAPRRVEDKDQPAVVEDLAEGFLEDRVQLRRVRAPAELRKRVEEDALPQRVQFELPALVPKLFLHLPSHVDVRVRPDHSEGRSLPVPFDDLASRQNPLPPAAGVANPVLRHEERSVGVMVPKRDLHDRKVVRVNPAEPRVEIRGDLPGRESEHSPEVLAEKDPSGPDIPVPEAVPGRLHAEPEADFVFTDPVIGQSPEKEKGHREEQKDEERSGELEADAHGPVGGLDLLDEC